MKYTIFILFFLCVMAVGIPAYAVNPFSLPSGTQGTSGTYSNPYQGGTQNSIPGIQSGQSTKSGINSQYKSQFLPATEINVDLSPKIPGPNQLVNVSLTSYNTTLDAATITWKIDGEIRKTGIGQKKFSFTTRDMNTLTTLSLVVSTQEGETIEKRVEIQPASVDLIWQSDSYVPPFYKGKALFSLQNRITFIALPHMTGPGGDEINPKNLIYKWTKNGTVQEESSGFAKNTYAFTPTVLSRPLTVSVEVTSPDSPGVGEARILATPGNPQIVLYKKNPLYGIEFQRALSGTVDMGSEKEIAVIGVPFFFGTTYSSDPDLSYNWSINRNAINDGLKTTTRIFRQKEGASGRSNISLSIENGKKILQVASGELYLEFGQ